MIGFPMPMHSYVIVVFHNSNSAHLNIVILNCPKFELMSYRGNYMDIYLNSCWMGGLVRGRDGECAPSDPAHSPSVPVFSLRLLSSFVAIINTFILVPDLNPPKSRPRHANNVRQRLLKSKHAEIVPSGPFLQ